MYHSLPTEIINYIYEYDGTHKKNFDYVILELIIRFKQNEYLNLVIKNNNRFLKTFFAFVNFELLENQVEELED